jgi:hypothetical protein
MSRTVRMYFNPETIERLTMQDVRQLERVMELMAKYRVSLQTIVTSLPAVKPFETWRYLDGTALDEALAAYDAIASHDGYQWTPPSERKEVEQRAQDR